MAKKLCSGIPPDRIYPVIEKVEKPKRGVEDIDSFFDIFGLRPSKVKRIRIQCPVCGRRVWSSVSQNDGEIYHTLPSHKPKGWWKKRGKNHKKKNESRIRPRSN